MQNEREFGKNPPPAEATESDEPAEGRRRFLGTLAAGAGAATLFAGLGSSPAASAQQGGEARLPP
jgi:hypothetical protein